MDIIPAVSFSFSYQPQSTAADALHLPQEPISSDSKLPLSGDDVRWFEADTEIPNLSDPLAFPLLATPEKPPTKKRSRESQHGDRGGRKGNDEILDAICSGSRGSRFGFLLCCT